jgi:hypothetical protein
MKTTTRFPLLVLVVAGPRAAFLLPLGDVAADVIRLRTGESIKGRPIQNRSDETILVIEDFLSGAERTLAWAVVDPEDRDRLQEDWGWKNKALATVMGHRIVQTLQDGSTDDVRGLIESEDGTYYNLRRGGRVLQVPKAQVAEVIEEEMDPRDIWSPEQLVARFLEELAKEGADLDALTTRQRYRIAEYAENAGDFETARTHYQACADDPEFLLAAVARQRLEGVERILKDAAALGALRDIRMALSLKSFQRVRELIDAFPAEHPDASEPVMARLERTKKDFVRERAEYFQLEAKINFPKIVQKAIGDKVKEKDVGLSDVTSWTRRELPDMAFQELAARFQRRDDAVTPEEARVFWEGRSKTGWRTATYGAGTFIVNPPKIKPPKRRAAPPKRSGGSGGGPAPQITIPKPPTRDGWWAGAAPKERASWVMAFFAQNSGLFEVSEEPKWTLCTTCNGEGLESKHLSTGEVLQYLCTRCGGAQRDMRIQYR